MQDFFGLVDKLVKLGVARVARDYEGACARRYDLVQRYDADVPFYLEQAGRGGGPVLELGCGTGRVLIPLARAGFEVTGLDLSQDMLDLCLGKLAAEPPEVARRVTTVRGDMRCFELRRRFRLAIMPLYTMNHLLTRQEKLDALSSVARHLESGGRLVLDVELATGIQDVPLPVLDVVRRDRDTEAVLLILFQRRLEPDGTVLLNLLDVSLGPDGRAELTAVASRESRTTAAELSELMAEAGFEIEALWAGYGGGELAPEAKSAVVVGTVSPAPSSGPATGSRSAGMPNSTNSSLT